MTRAEGTAFRSPDMHDVSGELGGVPYPGCPGVDPGLMSAIPLGCVRIRGRVNQSRIYRLTGALLMLCCTVGSSFTQPLLLEKQRPWKAWQTVLGKDAGYGYYGLPQGILGAHIA